MYLAFQVLILTVYSIFLQHNHHHIHRHHNSIHVEVFFCAMASLNLADAMDDREIGLLLAAVLLLLSL